MPPPLWSKRRARRLRREWELRRKKSFGPRAPPKPIILAIFGVAHYYREQGRHIVTARTEHKAVLDPCRELERRGWRVTYLAPDSGGVVDPGQIAAALRADTVLVSIMHVNNEIGVVQDIAAIGAICAEHGGARLHVDAAQSVGKIAIDFAELGVDLMSLSAHKAYGPKGVGALLVSRRAGGAGVHLTALQFGGGQEARPARGHGADSSGRRHGIGIRAGARGAALEAERVALLRERLWDGLARSAAHFAMEKRNARCRMCSMYPSRASRAKACSPRYAAASRFRPARPVARRCRTLLCAARLGPRRRLEREQSAVQLGPLHRRGGYRRGAGGRHFRGDTLAPDKRRMNYSQLTLHYFETAAGAGVLAGPKVIAVPPATARGGPGCSSTCSSAGGKSRRHGSWPSPARTPSRFAAWIAEHAPGPICHGCIAGERAGFERTLCGSGGETRPPVDHRGCVGCGAGRCTAATMIAEAEGCAGGGEPP